MHRSHLPGVVFTLVLVLETFAVCVAEELSEKNKPKPSPLITISKDTTRISGPIADDGYVMYLEALRKLCKDGVTPERNVVVSLWQAIGPYGELKDADFQKDYFKEMGIEPLPLKGDYYVNIHDVAREHLGAAAAEHEVQKLTEELWEQYSEATNGPWTKKDYPLLAKWIESNEKPMEVAVKGIMTRDQYYAPLLGGDDEFGNMLVGILLPTAQQTREFARLLSARAMYRLGGDDVDGAMNDLLACHRLARHYSKAPTLIEALVCYAIEGIASNGDFNLAHHAKLTTKQAKWYHDQLAKMPQPPSVVRCLDICERYGFLDCAVTMARQGPGAFRMIDALGGLAGDGGAAAKIDNPITRLLARATIDWDEPMKMGNQFYDRIVAAASLPTYKERAAAAAKIDKEFEKLAESAKDFSGLAASILGVKSVRKEIGKKIGTILCALLLPATSAASNAEDRIHMGIDLSKLSLALSAYRTEHAKYPDKLDELAPNFIKAIPLDRYSGEPLIYKRESGGYLLYSIGGNLKDDGGAGPFTDGIPPQDDLAVRSPEIMTDKD